MIGDRPVLDIGCGDGHLAFFLESLGWRVTAIDNPATNMNEMRGIRALHGSLGSKVGIVESDIDANFWPPGEEYFGAAFLLGVLYHLKNPFQVLESVALRARHLILSTRVTRYDPSRTVDLAAAPVAYLLADSEIRGDATNYWIFSQAGARRLLERSGWTVAGALATGNIDDSDPVSIGGDARWFCHAERRHRLTSGELIAGWHAPEGWSDWRWTERRFSVMFRGVPHDRDLFLSLRFLLPARMQERLGALTIGVTANGAPLPARAYAASGDHLYKNSVPHTESGEVLLEFTLDKWLPPEGGDLRELGVVVHSVELR
ncbi:MAG: class I SAM-dependent methyltransferase [Bryobacteraceae bacterium]